MPNSFSSSITRVSSTYPVLHRRLLPWSYDRRLRFIGADAFTIGSRFFLACVFRRPGCVSSRIDCVSFVHSGSTLYCAVFYLEAAFVSLLVVPRSYSNRHCAEFPVRPETSSPRRGSTTQLFRSLCDFITKIDISIISIHGKQSED